MLESSFYFEQLFQHEQQATRLRFPKYSGPEGA